jgi:transposase
MAYFAGLDVGLEETAICIIDGDGRIVRELTACSEPEALVGALQAIGVGYARVGLEACPLSSWLFEGLAEAGLPVVCLEVRHLRAALAAMTHKTDRNDARGIAQVLRTGWFRPVHVKTARSQEQRTLLTARKTMLEQAFDVENTIRGVLKGHGLKVGRVTRTTFAPRVRELVAASPALVAAIEPLLTAHASLRKSFAELHRQVLAVTRVDPVCRRLMTVPGVGAVTVLAYCSAVDIPERFSRSKAVGPHFGLVPRKYQSGATDRNGRITKAGDAMVRTALYEAANVLLTRVTRWSPLKAWAVRLAQRIGGKRAKVALARKLAVILHRLWMDGTTFAWTRERPMAVV